MSKQSAEQQRAEILSSRGENLLISASAGCGKTTVMVDRIVKLLLEEKIEMNDLMVVTYTNLAAAEMKRRIALKLEQYKGNAVVPKQLEKLDDSTISTLHKFCIEILRNYFYVVNVDPAFTILDDISVNGLKSQALSDVLKEYSQSDDKVYSRLYQMFWAKRSETDFKKMLLHLYDFSRCQVDFETWWQSKRNNFLRFDTDNPLLDCLKQDILLAYQNAREDFLALADKAEQSGENVLVDKCQANANACTFSEGISFDKLYNALCSTKLVSLGRYTRDEKCTELYNQFDQTKNAFNKYAKRFTDSFGGKPLAKLYDETSKTVVYADKLVEILSKFDFAFYQQKKQRGGLDFNDLEHKTLQVLQDEDALKEIKQKYKMIFVDEYQDTNGVQEAIIEKLKQKDNLFMVGDVKQSIYGFRQCDPDLFLQKQKAFSSGTREGRLIGLHENFRSNSEILSFVNLVFSYCMTDSFGKVDYKNDACLFGNLKQQSSLPSVTIDVIESAECKQESDLPSIYDLTQETEEPLSMSEREGEIICSHIREIVGKVVKMGDKTVKLKYEDIVILVRGIVPAVSDVYNCLVRNNVPVSASMKTESFACKEIKDLINLLRVIDNPLCDIPLAALCLSFFGKMTVDELAEIALYSKDESTSFYSKLQKYVGECKNETGQKLAALLDFVEEQRFLATSFTVDSLLLDVLKKTNYHLFVQSLPNGVMRVRKLYAFIDALRDITFCKSVDKFLSFVDDSEQGKDDSGVIDPAAVRIMTMHSAKGLEFPVVFLSNLATTFHSVGGKIVVNKDVGIALDYCSFKDRTKAVSLGKVATALIENKKQREEELRLLYVAMTRAKNHLYVLCANGDKQLLSPLVKTPRSANCHSDWILSALKKNYGRIGGDCLLNNVAIKFHKQDEALQSVQKEELLCPQNENLEETLASMNYAYPYANAVNLPLKVVSSKLDRHYLDDEELAEQTVPLTLEDKTATGIAYHKVLESIPIPCTREQLESAVILLKGLGEDVENVDKELLLKVVNNEEVQKLVEGGKTFRETPFLLKTDYSELDDTCPSEKVVLQGVIDLLALRENEAIVLDYKYTDYSSNIKKNYRKQLESYALAVKKICGVEKVEKYVLSIKDNKLIKL